MNNPVHIPVAAPAGDAVLAGALSVGLVADLARGADGVAVAGLARPLVADGALLVAEVALLAVVAVAAGSVVAALEAHAARDAAGQLVQGNQMHISNVQKKEQVSCCCTADVCL